MSFHIDNWKRVQSLDEVIRHGASPDQVTETCRSAVAEAANEGDESERIYLSGRLAELLEWQSDLRAAAEVYERIWPGTITPPMYGLRYLKLLLQFRDYSGAERVLQQMQHRLTADAAEPGRLTPPYIERLSVLLGEGLLVVRRGDSARLNAICAEIMALQQHIPWLPYVDTAFLEALVEAKEYGLARQVLDFIAVVRPKGR